MSTVQDEKGLNAQAGGAGGQGQATKEEKATKEESWVAPNLTEFAPLIEFATGSFLRLNDVMAQILIDFRAENKAKLEAQKAQEELDDIMWVQSLLGSIDVLRDTLLNLFWREYNESFFNNPANLKRFAKIVTKLAIIFNKFESGKVDYIDVVITLRDIRLELQEFLFKVIGAKPLLPPS